jgi:UDP-GlcNAc:undecaprenyl-phosphate GlcNAc-1-phosphate transferase
MELYFSKIIENYEYFLFIVFVISFNANYYLSNKIRFISKKKRLFSEVSDRSSHSEEIPNLGGATIFVVVMIIILLVIGSGFSNPLSFNLAGAFILFLTGLKDDLIGTKPQTKLFLQFLGALIFVLNPEFVLGNLGGFFWVNEIDPNWTYLIGILFIVFFVNAFNLSDGIDGLAGLIAIFCSVTFGIIFYSKGLFTYTILSCSIFGSVSSFLLFNFESKQKKLFMGDTGSLVIGFLLATMALRIIEVQPIKPGVAYFPSNPTIFILLMFFYPILDTSRVFVKRLINKKPFWKPDRGHIHHLLIDLGIPHWLASISIIILNIFLVFGFFKINELGNLVLHLYLFCAVITFIAIVNKIELIVSRK